MGATKTMLLEELEREQIERERDEDAAAEARIVAAIVSPLSQWIPADKELPGNTRSVLATDSEGHFVACYDGEWQDEQTGEAIDSVVTHWMELPDLPE